MAIISELFFKMTDQPMADDWAKRIIHTAQNLSNNECHWIDFGTRRRYSYEVQNEMVLEMKKWSGFLGTSNPHLAMKHGQIQTGLTRMNMCKEFLAFMV